MGLAESTARLLRYLEVKDDILLLTTSSRSQQETWDTPKTTALAERVRARLEESAKRVMLLDVTRLKIYTCEEETSAADAATIAASRKRSSTTQQRIRRVITVAGRRSTIRTTSCTR